MIDLLEIKIPFDASLVDTVDDRHALVGMDLFELDIPLGAKSVHLRDDGSLGTSCLYSPYQSLPTSFTGMALKVNLDGYFFPHVTIKASPAKILQGHNVFGSDNFELAISEMFYWLDDAYPVLSSLLAFQCAEIVKIDVTYTAKISNQRLVKQFIDYISRVSNGHTKPTSNRKFETTAYWGGSSSRLIRQKCYGKWEEYKAQLDDYSKRAKKGDLHAIKVLEVMSDERLQSIARTSIRWECTFLKRWLERNGYPINVWEFARKQKSTKDMLPKMWEKGFCKIRQALEGQEMLYVDDTKLLERLKSRFVTTTKTGRLSYRKALNIYSFYNQLKSIGYDEMKSQQLYGSRRFQQLIADLISVGFSKAYLQNLHVKNDETKVIPFVQMINIDFSKQFPDWYEEPISTPQKLRLSA